MLILRGVQSAALVNLVTTIAKLVPVFVFIVIGIFAFHIDTFLDGFWGQTGSFSWGAVGSQVKKYNACNFMGIYWGRRCCCFIQSSKK